MLLSGSGAGHRLAAVAVHSGADSDGGHGPAVNDEPNPLDPGVVRGAAGRFDATLDKTLRAAVVPYGYTVTIWATGAYLIRDQAEPGAVFGHALMFIFGALLAFALLATLSQRRRAHAAPPPDEPLPIHPDSSHPIMLAGLHILAAGIAFGAGALVKVGFGELAWFLTPFTVTVLYLALSSLELAMAIEMHRRRFLPWRRSRTVPAPASPAAGVSVRERERVREDAPV